MSDASLKQMYNNVLDLLIQLFYPLL